MRITQVITALAPHRGGARRRSHLAYVDGARALAALYVVLHHCYQWTWNMSVPRWAWPFVGWLAYGHFAVSAFIAISGFSLMLRVVRDDGELIGGAWRFFARRAWRILPPYYFAIAGALLLDWRFIGRPDGTPWDVTLPVTPDNVLAHILLVQNFGLTAIFRVNGVMWSIAVECQIYLFFPLLVRLVRRTNALVVTLGAVVLCAATYVALPIFWGMLTHVGPVGAIARPYLAERFMMVFDYLGLFVLGMLAAMIAYTRGVTCNQFLRRVPWGTCAAVTAVALAGVFARYGPNMDDHTTLLADTLTAVVTLTLFLASAKSASGIISQTMGWRPLAFTGTYAYSIYLMHAPILALLYSYVFTPYITTPLGLTRVAANYALILLALPIVLVTTYGFFWLFERPFLRPPIGRRTAPAPSAEVPKLAAAVVSASAPVDRTPVREE